MYMYENNYIPTIKPTKIELVADDLFITLPDELTLLNGKKWHMLICEKLPQGENIGQVIFIVKEVKYPGMNGIGNILRTDALRCRRRYTLTYGWDDPHFMVCGTRESAYVPVSAATV